MIKQEIFDITKQVLELDCMMYIRTNITSEEFDYIRAVGCFFVRDEAADDYAICTKHFMSDTYNYSEILSVT